jgi:hypothetical protein
MKGQDLVIALMLVRAESDSGRNIPALSASLGASTSVVHDSLRRLVRAGLVRPRTHAPVRPHLLEFLEHGLRFVFPADLGRVTRGVPTASSAPPLDAVFGHGETENEFVWPAATGQLRGTSLQPLHPGVPAASLRDPDLYQLLAVLDGLRVQDPRVRKEAVREIRQRLGGST